MKISFTPALNSQQIQAFKAKKEVSIPNKGTIKDIPNSSMQALIGKSQVVSFSGLNSTDGKTVKHSCSEGFGANARKEEIFYDKTSGNYAHIVTDKYGNLVSSEEYFPQKGSEIITTIDDYGKKTITTTDPKSVTREVYDDQDREILIDYQDMGGFRNIQTTDYKRGRRVIKESLNGSEPNVTVIDLKTRQAVMSGPLVIDTFYDKKSDTYITHNIITKDVLKREKYNKRNILLFSYEYNPQTKLPVKEVVYDNQTGGYKTTTRTGVGRNNKIEEVYESRDKRNVQVLQYNRDGKTVDSNVLYRYTRNGDMSSITRFLGDSDIIETKTTYLQNGSRTEDTYRTNNNEPNTVASRLFIDDNETLKYEIEFRQDGKTPSIKREFLDTNETLITKFTKYGEKARKEYYDSTDNLKKTIDYDVNSGTIAKVVLFNHQTKQTCEIIYDEYGEYPANETIRDEKGTILHYLEYREGTSKPELKRDFNSDRSYKETYYDEDGNITGTQEFYANGRKKPSYNEYYRQSYNQYNTGSTQRTYRTEAQSPRESEDDFISRVASQIGSKTNDFRNVLTNSDWQRLSQIMGVQDAYTLQHLDKKTYKELAFKFHPDLVHDKSLEEKYSKLCQILNGINEANNKRTSGPDIDVDL